MNKYIKLKDAVTWEDVLICLENIVTINAMVPIGSDGYGGTKRATLVELSTGKSVTVKESFDELMEIIKSIGYIGYVGYITEDTGESNEV